MSGHNRPGQSINGIGWYVGHQWLQPEAGNSSLLVRQRWLSAGTFSGRGRLFIEEQRTCRLAGDCDQIKTRLGATPSTLVPSRWHLHEAGGEVRLCVNTGRWEATAPHAQSSIHWQYSGDGRVKPCYALARWQHCLLKTNNFSSCPCTFSRREKARDLAERCG